MPECVGEITFTDDSVCLGTVQGQATFQDTAVNEGTVDNATFQGNSTNIGTIVEQVVFEESATNSGDVQGVAVFSGNTVNEGIVEQAIFQDTAVNNGQVTTATFTDSAANGAEGTVTEAIFTDTATNSGIVVETATFTNSSVNEGDVQGTALLLDSSNNTGTIAEAQIATTATDNGTITTFSTFTPPASGAYSHGYYIDSVKTAPPNYTTQVYLVGQKWYKYDATGAGVPATGTFTDGTTVNGILVTAVYKVGTQISVNEILDYRYSTAFNGQAGLQLSDSSSVLFAESYSNFTIEFWVKFNNLDKPRYNILNVGALPHYGPTIGPDFNIIARKSHIEYVTVDNYGWERRRLAAPLPLILNTWYHVAVTRDNNDLRLFVNGIMEDAITVSNNEPNFANNDYSVPMQVGCANSEDAGKLDGYLTNLRIVGEQALYTTNFTPPSAHLTATGYGTVTQITSGTPLLLTLQTQQLDSLFTTLTGTITTTISAHAWSQSTSSLHIDSSGVSMLFDGDVYVEYVPQNNISIRNSDFTQETFVKLSYPEKYTFYWLGEGGQNNRACSIVEWGSPIGNLETDAFFGDPTNLINQNRGTPYIVSDNKWHHVGLQRKNGVFSCLFDGQIIEQKNEQNITYGYSTCCVGRGYAYYQLLKGLLFNARISNVARYDDSSNTYTVPTQAFTTDANTLFLLRSSDDIVSNVPNTRPTVTSVWNHGRTNSKDTPFRAINSQRYSTRFIDGTFAAWTRPLRLAPFTIEFWIKPASFINTERQGIIGTRLQYWPYVRTWSIDLQPNALSGCSLYFMAGNISTADTQQTYIPFEQWTHVAVVREQPQSVKIYINGACTVYLDASQTSQQSMWDFKEEFDSDGQGWDNFYTRIGGRTNNGVFNEMFIGNLCDVRMIKDQALYTSNFTPPDGPLTTTGYGTTSQNITGTVLLLTCNNDNLGPYEIFTTSRYIIEQEIGNRGNHSHAFLSQDVPV